MESVTFYITCQLVNMSLQFHGKTLVATMHARAFRKDEDLDISLTTIFLSVECLLFSGKESFYVILTLHLAFAVNLALLQEVIVGLIATDVIVKIVCN